MPGKDSDASSVLRLVGDAVTRGQCILFLGSGVHAPPPARSALEHPPDHRPPIGRALSHQLASTCDFAARFPGEHPGNLQRVALAYEDASEEPER